MIWFISIHVFIIFNPTLIFLLMFTVTQGLNISNYFLKIAKFYFWKRFWGKMKFFLCSIFFTTPWLCLQIYIHYSWYEHNHCFMLRSWERYPVRTLKIYQNIQKQFENHVIYFKNNKSECFCRITEQWDCYFPSFIFIYLCDSSESLLNVLTTTRNSYQSAKWEKRTSRFGYFIH